MNPASLGIDVKSVPEILDIIHREDLRAWEAVGLAVEAVGAVVEAVVRSFQAGGRLFYVGAGTSGRLGVLDASECPPTFGVALELVQGVIAGGEQALRTAVEGAEDSAPAGAAEMQRVGVRSRDIVCGIAASGTTPFVWGALEEAAGREATTVLITSNPGWSEHRATGFVDHVVLLPVGPEVIAGSSRMKAGTATKMVLNMITTAAMIRCGKVYDNLMVDLRAVNRKLQERAVRLVSRVAGMSSREAGELLERSGGEVKAAIIMSRGLNEERARELLQRHGGILRQALAELEGSGERAN